MQDTIDWKHVTLLNKKNEWKGSELSAKSTGKGLYKVFKDVVNELKNALPNLV